MELADRFIWFVIYSFWGFCLETLISFAANRRLINKGFLYGPFIPMSGLTALLAVLLCYGNTYIIYIYFLAGVVISLLIEGITGVILEKAFALRFWDYHHHRIRVHRKANVLRAVISGILCTIIILFVHKHVEAFTAFLPSLYLRLISAFFVLIIGADTLLSLRHIARLTGGLERKAASRKDKSLNRRLFAAFPRLKSLEHDAVLRRVKEATFAAYNRR